MGTDLVVHPLNPFPKSVGSAPMTIPTLTTQRLTLRPFRASDDQAYHQIVAEAGVLQYFPEPTPPSLEKVQATLSRLNEHWEKYGYGVWAVELAGSGKLIPVVNLEQLRASAPLDALAQLLGFQRGSQ